MFRDTPKSVIKEEDRRVPKNHKIPVDDCHSRRSYNDRGVPCFVVFSFLSRDNRPDEPSDGDTYVFLVGVVGVGRRRGFIE